MSTGLKVTKVADLYPFELSTKEVYIHEKNVSEYKFELSKNLFFKALRYQPDSFLIRKQPEFKTDDRQSCLEFLLEISTKTKVTDGVFYRAVRIFDRYCSKRIVLKSQLRIVLATSLWLAAKTYGGCHHTITDSKISTGGRFHGPNPRARVPKLSDLIYLCQDDQLDRSMFVQMERHFLNTLDWDLEEPELSNWLLEFNELNLMQLRHFNDDGCFDEKIEMVQLKRIISDLSLFELDLIELHPESLTQVIFHILEEYIFATKGILDTFKSELLYHERLSKFDLERYSDLIYNKLIWLLGNSQFLFTQYITNSNSTEFYRFLLSKSDQSEVEDAYSNIHSLSSIETIRVSGKPNMYLTPNSTKSSSSIHNFRNGFNGLPTPPHSKRESPTFRPERQSSHLNYKTPLTPTEW